MTWKGLTMIKCLLNFALIIMLNLWSSFGVGQVSIKEDSINLTPHLGLFLEKSPLVSREDIVQQEFASGDFRPMTLGVSQYPVWLKVELSNPTNEVLKRVLSYEFRILDELDIYVQRGGGLSLLGQFGNDRPMANEFSLYYMVPFEWQPSQVATFYLRIKSRDTIQMPVWLRSHSEMGEHLLSQCIYHGFYGGIVLAIMLYNLFLAFKLRDASYGVYVMFGVSCFLMMVSFLGYGRHFLWRGFHEFNRISPVVFGNLCFLSALWFSTLFFPVKEIFGKGWRLYLWMGGGWLVSLGIVLLDLFPYEIIVFVAPVLLVPSVVLMCWPAVIQWRAGDAIAKYFLLAWVCAFLGAAMTILAFLGLTETYKDPLFPAQVGLLFELSLLSIIMAMRLNRIRKHKLDREIRLQQTMKSHILAHIYQERLWSRKDIPKAMDFHWYNEMADHTGGDWYGSYFDKGRQRLITALGDVSGHGILSAVVTAELTGALRMLVSSLGDCATAEEAEAGLNKLARGLNRAIFQKYERSEYLSSVSLILVDIRRKKIYCLNGGHLPVYVISNGKCRAIASQGSLLGLGGHVKFGLMEVEWTPGATMLVYTDGLIENQSRDGKYIKPRRLAKVLEKASDPKTAVALCVKEKNDLLGDYPPKDDTSILAFRIPA